MSSTDRIKSLVQRVIATTDEEELRRTMEELRSALHEHIQRTQQIN